MKKCLCLVLALFFTMASINTFAHTAETPTLVASVIEAPTLPQTYVKDEFSLMSETASLEDYLKELWTNKTTYVKIFDYFKIPTQEFFDKYWQILHDNPEFFWVGSQIQNPRQSGGKIYDFEITYEYTDPDVIAQKKRSLDEATAEILLHITDDMSDFEKVMTVHDYMVLHYTYGTSDVMHSIFIMTEKTGVCMGYALAFNHLMNVLGIESTYVPSQEMNHAWNLVKLDGKWYHIDVTFDDPVNANHKDMYAHINHNYALLSSEAIQNAEDPHTGFDIGTLVADSTLYDNAPWRSSTGNIVKCNSKLYYISGKSVVDEDGNIIRKNLDGGDGKWSITKTSYITRFYGGLTSYGNTLYYNTDDAIYSYDTESKKETKILSKYGICGIFADKNILKYSKYTRSTGNIEYDSEITLEKEEGPVIGSSIHAGDKIITPIYKEDDTPMIVFCHNSNHNQLFRLEGQGTYAVESEAGDIFFWTDKLKPLSKKHHVE
ncbi:MAG: hypothetical protein E7394_01465 [Ruminococcaceae bacterium]|nr:hypothetical protein [Oscillospiraceae bacterium]